VPDPIDIIMLSHDRLDHLRRTVDALEARTRTPYRLTLVDNASEPATRAWIEANRHRFHQLLLRPTNEHTRAFRHGIAATTSDPYIVTDPDLIVPEGDPDWLARLLAIADAHPGFGLLGMGLDPANRPAVTGPEVVDRPVDEDVAEGPVGTWFQLIRRGALKVPYTTDGQVCLAVERAGHRVGWTRRLRAYHLGWDDAQDNPQHLLEKHLSGDYPSYSEIADLPVPASLRDVARAAPLLRETRRRGIPDALVLDLTRTAAAVSPDVVGAREVVPAAAVLLDDPALIARAADAASDVVLLDTTLEAVGGRLPSDLAPAGFRGEERPGAGALVLEVAADADARGLVGFSTWTDRDAWLEALGAPVWQTPDRRLFVFERAEPRERPAAVEVRDRWRPTPAMPGVRREQRSPRQRARAAVEAVRSRLGR
jgi:hypothetical protein